MLCDMHEKTQGKGPELLLTWAARTAALNFPEDGAFGLFGAEGRPAGDVPLSVSALPSPFRVLSVLPEVIRPEAGTADRLRSSGGTRRGCALPARA